MFLKNIKWQRALTYYMIISGDKMTRHGEGKTTMSTSAAKYKRSKRIQLVRSGKASMYIHYSSVDNALETAGL